MAANFQPIYFPNLKDRIEASTTPYLSALILFSIFSVTSLFCYFLHICAHGRRRESDSPPARAAAAGLDPAALGSLPVSSIGSNVSKKPSPGAECAICLGVFREGDNVKVLPGCRHGFHSDCVDSWLRTRPSCPLCRGCVLCATGQRSVD